ncbi:MAG: ABC transporter ATP-binding protein, partial [Defluviitaleaceae bacterium]|nr:ABC transporter ATP-binding protein [Defluviitaleaceae bacterium]
MRALKWMYAYIKPYRLLMGAGLVLDISITVMFVVSPYIIGRIVLEVLQEGKTERLLPYLGTMCGVIVVRSVFRYFQLLIFESASQSILFNMRRDLYARVESQSYSFFDENRVGDIMARMTGDLDAIRHFVAYETYAIPENILTLLFGLIMMFTLSVPLASAMLVIAPAVTIIAFKQSREIKPAYFNIREQYSHLNSVCEENIGGNRVVKAFAREDYEIEKLTKASGLYYQSHVKAASIGAKYNPMIETCAAALMLVSLLFGSLLIINGRMELWQLITFNGYLWMINNPTRMFGMFVNDA